MKLFELTSRIAKGGHGVSRAFTRWFPTPTVIYPRAAGIDISDASIKWLALAPFGSGYRVETFGQESIPPGVVVNGTIRDVEVLGRALKAVKKRLGGIDCVHAALPEEAAYIFEMHVPDGVSRREVLHMIEFEFEGRVPIAPAASVFDFDVIKSHDGVGEEIAVSVFPRELAESYVETFNAAGIRLLSLEVEARSIARAVSSGAPEEPITLLIDFGHARTGFAVLKLGIPIFTSTVEVGGDGLHRILMEKLALSAEDAISFTNDQGLIVQGGIKSAGLDAISGTVSMLGDEVARHYHYWDTRRNEQGDRMTPVGRVVLVGGSANLNGITDYIAGRVQAPTVIGDVWQNICNFDEYVPPIDRRESLVYATAVGLALRSLSV